MKKQKEKQVIGRREFVDFPDLGILNIEAKVDTGAYTSVLHCRDIRLKDSGGKTVLSFKPLDPAHPSFQTSEKEITDYYEKNIKNSFGESEKRFIIKTRIRIAGRLIRSVISLTDRGSMRYPVLIGRKMLKNKFIVDVGRGYLHEKK